MLGPEKIKPVSYGLSYSTIDLDACIFRGEVRIEIEVKVATSEVTLNSADLWIHGVTATVDPSSPSMSAIALSFDVTEETVTVHFPQVLAAGTRPSIRLRFSGELNDKLVGLYRSLYVSPEGETRVLACTQFEPCDARRAFPCFDAPALKAQFTLDVMTPMDRIALSNTPVKFCTEVVVDLPNGKKERRKHWKFEETPVMSTYLFALVVGEFDSLSMRDKLGIPTTIYLPRGKAHLGHFALKTASAALEYYATEVYKMPFALPKSDLVAIANFSAGAMENWGLVTYRESKLLADEKTSSIATLKSIARTICHELAHQYFGNLVTMENWTYLWLNEGFARYMEFVAVDRLYPEWNIWEDFCTSVLPVALSLDALRSSHPVEVPCNHESEVSSFFDMISYAKGASLIRMCADYVGESNFWKAIQLYLKRHQYGNTVSGDLWKALSEVSGDAKLTSTMHSWVSQTGYPVLCIAPEGKGVSQERFLADGSKCTENLSWPVPVKVLVEGEESPRRFHLSPGKCESSLSSLMSEAAKMGKWVKINAGQVGFYRVQYSHEGWTQLQRASSSGAVSAIDRMGLILDSAALACAGRIGMDVSLSQCLACRLDDAPVVIDAVASVLGRFSRLYENEEWFTDYAEMVRAVCSPMLDRIGLSREDGEDCRLTACRPVVISTLAFVKEPRTLDHCLDLFRASSPSSPIPADIQGTVLATAIRVLGVEAFEKVLSMYRETDNVEVRVGCLQALGCGTTPSLLRRAFDWALDSGEVRSQDLPYPIGSICESQMGAHVSWSVFRSRFDELHARLGPTGFLWQRMVGACVSGPYTEDHAAEVEAFFALPGKELGCAVKNYDQSLERLRARAAQLDRDRKAIPTWLAKKPWAT